MSDLDIRLTAAADVHALALEAMADGDKDKAVALLAEVERMLNGDNTGDNRRGA